VSETNGCSVAQNRIYLELMPFCLGGRIGIEEVDGENLEER
jgi:hypothetical protein